MEVLGMVVLVMELLGMVVLGMVVLVRAVLGMVVLVMAVLVMVHGACLGGAGHGACCSLWRCWSWCMVLVVAVLIAAVYEYNVVFETLVVVTWC